MGFMRDHHSRREIVQTGSNFRMHGAEFPFDPLVKRSDSVDRAVFHVWAELPLLSVGLHRAGPGDALLRAAPAGELLVLHYFLRRLPGGKRLYRGGSAAGPGAASRRVSGVWATVTHTKVETDILDNPSVANYEELGELYKDQGQYEKARDAFNHAITGRSDSIYTFYSRAQSSLGLNDLAAAIPDLERVVAGDRKFDYYRAAGLLASAYARTGQLERANQLFAEVTQTDFDDSGNAFQLREFSEDGEPAGRGARVVAKAASEEAHATAVHAEARTAVVSERQGAVERTSQRVELAAHRKSPRWRAKKFGGARRNRTADNGFADHCLTTWRPRRRTEWFSVVSSQLSVRKEKYANG